MQIKIFRLALLVCICSTIGARANIRLPRLISNGMVLQRNTPLTLWGWADAGERVSVQFKRKKYKTITAANGSWKLILPAAQVGGPFNMTLQGNNHINLSDIWVGDVWFCSGQSNMVVNMERVKERYPDDIATAKYPQIRNFFIPAASDVTKVHDDLPGGSWVSTSPQTVLEFGAASYFFARSLFERYHIPIGIINASVGGTPIEAWTSADGLQEFADYAAMLKQYKDTAYVNNQVKLAQIKNRTPIPVLGPDQGLSGPQKWFDNSYVPVNWRPFVLPGYWDDQGTKGLNGVLWFRKEIDVPAGMTGTGAKLFMGRIVDADEVYINGILSGATTYQYPPRRYSLPAGRLKAGKNIIVVRVTNSGGKGGFVPDKPYYLQANGQKIDLRGDWQYQIGQIYRPVPFTGGSFSQQNSPNGLYNTMVAPVINYRVKGFAWYQGEANTGYPGTYKELLPALINDWRLKWHQGNLPFVYVQLPNFNEVQYNPVESNWAQLRQGQLSGLKLPGTGMAIAIDAGEWNDIHPLNKKAVGERLALAARHVAYGEELVYTGPIFQSATIADAQIWLSFDNIGKGLKIKAGGTLAGFAVAGADKKFVWAKAAIDGGKVKVWSDEVLQPKYVRYAWADNPEWANLLNSEGLPASPFETDITIK